MDETVFWQALAAAAAIATVFGGLITWGVASWLQFRNRPEADWAFSAAAYAEETTIGSRDDQTTEMQFVYTGRLANVGDASAFRVTLVPSSGSVRFYVGKTGPSGGRTAHEFIAAMRPGEDAEFSCTVLAREWNDYEIILDWITSPTRLKKHAQLKIRPSEQVERPKLFRRDSVLSYVEKPE